MYVIGKNAANIMGPGTGLVQRIDWSVPDERRMGQGFGYRKGLGGCGCAGLTGCGCKGLGLFDSMDVSTWGWQEMAIAGVVGYMVVSTIFGTSRAVGRIRAIPGERRKRKAADYRRKADELTRKGGGRRRKAA